MQATQLLQQIFENNAVNNAKGEKFTLHSAIDKAEGSFLHNLVLQYKPQTTIEIGCAYGISSLYICDALRKNTAENTNTSKKQAAQHHIIDPFQTTQWKSVGIDNLKNCDLNFFELIEKPSELALPNLLAQGKQFDFAFIDGWHTLDHTLLDLFYVNKMLKVGGILVIDDVLTIKPVNKTLRYFMNYPAYQFIGKAPHKHSWKRQLYYTAIEAFSLFSYLVPFRTKIFSADLLFSDRQLNIDSSMVAFEKIAEDERSWNWYKEF
jgi:predicted O-methyltransferase YrrM